jgi:dihydroorotase
VEAARKRGVFFDVGHGGGSFAFKTARTMLANGFLPDTISSDVHVLCINGPAFDQVTTLSKFLCLGMRPERGHRRLNLQRGLRSETAGTRLPQARLGGRCQHPVFDEGRYDYVDVVGEHLTGDRKLNSRGVVVAGKWWWPE